MISNKAIRNICFIISVISLVVILLLYSYPNESSCDNIIDLFRNLSFSIFGSTLVSGLTAHIYISSQIKETHITIAIKLKQACNILKDPINSHILKDHPFEIAKDNYEKIYSLIKDILFIIKEFELRNMSRFPIKKAGENISTLSIIDDIRDANFVLVELQREMSSPNPNDDRISELWNNLIPYIRNANKDLDKYLIKIYGKTFVETTDLSSI